MFEPLVKNFTDVMTAVRLTRRVGFFIAAISALSSHSEMRVARVIFFGSHWTINSFD